MKMADLPGSHLLRRLPVSIWGLVVIVALVALFLPGFARIGNITNVLRVGAILALASYGQTIVLISGGIDFSIGSSVALCSVVTALAVQQLPLGLALTAGFASIIVVGAINGLLIAYLKLSPFLVTLGMLLLVHGFAAIVAGGLPVEVPDREGIHTLSGGGLLGVPYPVIIAGLAAGALYLLLERTTLGRSWFLIGSNLAGRRSDRHPAPPQRLPRVRAGGGVCRSGWSDPDVSRCRGRAKSLSDASLRNHGRLRRRRNPAYRRARLGAQCSRWRDRHCSP